MVLRLSSLDLEVEQDTDKEEPVEVKLETTEALVVMEALKQLADLELKVLMEIT